MVSGLSLLRSLIFSNISHAMHLMRSIGIPSTSPALIADLKTRAFQGIAEILEKVAI